MGVFAISPASLLDRALPAPRPASDLAPRDLHGGVAPQTPPEAGVLSGQPVEAPEPAAEGQPTEGFRRPTPDPSLTGPTYGDQPGQPGTPLQRAYADLWPPLWPPIWPPVWRLTETPSQGKEEGAPLPETVAPPG